MTRSKLYELVECAFNQADFEEALCEAIQNLIDYDAVAERILEESSLDIEDVAVAVAREQMDMPPF